MAGTVPGEPSDDRVPNILPGLDGDRQSHVEGAPCGSHVRSTHALSSSGFAPQEAATALFVGLEAAGHDVIRQMVDGEDRAIVILALEGKIT